MLRKLLPPALALTVAPLLSACVFAIGTGDDAWDDWDDDEDRQRSHHVSEAGYAADDDLDPDEADLRERIASAARTSFSVERLERLSDIAREYELDGDLQLRLIDAIYRGGISSDMADALLVVVREQRLAPEAREFLLRGLGELAEASDRERVRQALGG